MIAAALALLQASAPLAFAPPLDRSLTVTLGNDRTTSAGALHFVAVDRLRFGRDTNGLFADWTLVTTTSDARGGTDAFFQQALAALKGRTLRFRLDAEGGVVSLDDLDASWDQLCSAIAGAEPGTRQAATNAAIARALRGFPAAQRLAMLSDDLARVIAPPTLRTAPMGLRAITLTGQAPAGQPVPLVGSEAVAAASDGTRTIVDTASGDVPAAAGQDAAAPVPDPQAIAHLTLTRTRSVDPATGLVRSMRETTVTTLPGTAAGETVRTLSVTG